MVRLSELSVTFSGARKPVHAVSGVSLEVQRGEVVALIGESGSGKSVTMRTLLRLHPERRTRMGGTVQVAGRDVLAMSQRELADFRGKVASMIFQEPLLALDPVYSVGAQIVESIRRHESVSAAEAQQRALALFERVRIPSPERRLQAYPHEMSGGMRQRAMIALALACKPQLLLADEPTTALDATVQIQILLLLRELQRDLGLSVIFVTHDIGAAVEFLPVDLGAGRLLVGAVSLRNARRLDDRLIADVERHVCRECRGSGECEGQGHAGSECCEGSTMDRHFPLLKWRAKASLNLRLFNR